MLDEDLYNAPRDFPSDCKWETEESGGGRAHVHRPTTARDRERGSRLPLALPVCMRSSRT
jgi:hypothetical protein